MKFLKRTVVLALIACLLFTAVVIALSVCGIAVPDVLIQYFFVVFGVELAATAFIRIADKTLERLSIKAKIADMKSENIKPEREDFQSNSNSDYYTNNYDYGG